MKNRKEKMMEYHAKYNDIPLDNLERLSWMYDTLKPSQAQQMEIFDRRNAMLEGLYYKSFKVILYEEPEGSPRPRFRLINRSNISNQAMANSSFVHVYSLTGKEDNMYMSRLINGEDFNELDQLICTPCIIEYTTFSKIPSAYNKVETFLSEIGLIRPIAKSDFDNIAKKYSDMYNHNVWLDDIMVIDGRVNKFYSVLPRVEITIHYLNMVYNKYQFNNIVRRKDFTEDMKLEYFGGKI